MDVTRLLIALFVGMAVLIFLIMKTRLHPSLSLVISACVVGIVGGVELASIPGLITSGFGNTLAGIGLVIGVAVSYVFGTAWFVFQMGCELSYALAVCVYPFIAFDLAKVIIACVVGALLRKRLTQAGVLKLA
mgnify:CR=1 FL=1